MFFYLKIAFFLLFLNFSQGARLYNYDKQMCCNGNVINITQDKNPFEFDCCGTEAMERWPEVEEQFEFTHLCCHDKLHKSVNFTSLCCGTETYDMMSEACLKLDDDYLVIPVSIENSNESKTEVCGKTKEEHHFYDPNMELCCSGVLYNITMEVECCGDSVVDNVETTCCFDYVRDEKTKRWKETSTVAPYNGVARQKSTCCNGIVIDATKQLCCDGVPVDKPEEFSFCCGQALITDTETQQCVDDVIVSRENGSQFYCGGQLHVLRETDIYYAQCINNAVVVLGADEWVCSVNGVKVRYNTTRQVCADDVVVDLSDDDMKNERFQICDPFGSLFEHNVNAIRF